MIKFTKHHSKEKGHLNSLPFSFLMPTCFDPLCIRREIRFSVFENFENKLPVPNKDY